MYRLLLPLLLAAPPLEAAVQPDDLMEHIRILAADDFLGRKPGTAGETGKPRQG